MKKWLFLLSSTFFSTTVCYAAIPNQGHPSEFVGPIVRGSLTSALTDTSAYSFAGEAGEHNVRMGMTLGANLLDVHSIKVSGEYLWQRMNYSFFSGEKTSWSDQGAVGAMYQLDMHKFSRFDPQFNLSAYYANASATALGTTSGIFTNSAGLTLPYIAVQRTGNSYARGFSPGFTFKPWFGTRAGVDLNYDHVQYDQKYQPSSLVSGIGATLRVSQQITQRVFVEAAAGVRQPFNNYQASVVWDNVPYFSSWAFKLMGDYTIGKQNLPSTYNVGLAADFFLDMWVPQCCTEYVKNDFLIWTAKPAVYMPEVLALADESVVTPL